VNSQEDFENHISYYKKIIQREIRTPEMFSTDKKHLMLKFASVGMEKNGDKVWSKTLVNFNYKPEKEVSNIAFLVRAIEYAADEDWTDLHAGNILFEDGHLYLIDYVPGRGRHKIGSFGLARILPDEKASLKKEMFDSLLEKALTKFPSQLVDYSGLITLRENI
jgi:tRNA A-37 threonylcarbamoyl transferase component Bud32